MKPWITRCLELLKASLSVPKHELNELDWKAALSPDKKRLTEHLSALSNQPGGGWLVFGVDSAGTPSGVDEPTVEKTVNQLANLGREGLVPPVALDHAKAASMIWTQRQIEATPFFFRAALPDGDGTWGCLGVGERGRSGGSGVIVFQRRVRTLRP